jgi:hypothetical protein
MKNLEISCRLDNRSYYLLYSCKQMFILYHYENILK